MSESEAVLPEAALAGSTSTERAEGRGPAYGPLLAVGGTVGAIVLALVASGASKPLLLTAMALLAMLGAFFLFAMIAGHIRLGERVRDSDLLRLVAEGLPDGVMIATADGRPYYANGVYEEFAGVSPAGQPLMLDAAFSGEPAAAPALYRLTRAARLREALSEDFAIPAKGTAGVRQMRVACRPLRQATLERVLGPLVLWTIGDITEEKTRDAERIGTLETRLALYDRLPVGLVAVGEDGLLGHANAAFTDWLGLAPGAARERGTRLADLVSSDGAELLSVAARRPEVSVTGLDLDVTTVSGRVVPMRFFARTGEEDGLLLAACNREAEIAAAADGDGEAGVRFARFFKSAPFGIATVASDGRIASANSAFTRMIIDGSSGIGALAADVLGRSADDAVQNDIAAGLAQVLAGKSHAAPIEITVGSGREFTRRVFMSPLTRSGESREAAVLYVIDATEQKALELKFAQSSKMEAIGKLAGGIAHDFNNMLTGIIGFSDLLLQTHRPADPAYKDIMNIRSSARRAAGLVAKLSAFSRQQTLQMEPLQLGEVLTDLGPLLKRSIGEQIELKVAAGRDLWYVKADKIQFDQVIINFAVNARDAMASGGKLTIRTRNITERESQRLGHSGMPVGEYVAVEVEDTGSGMSREVMAKIFDPFFTTKGVGKGTGLGLATVYGIVKQTGGYVFVDSEVGRGTTFKVYLPRHVPDEDDVVVDQKAQKKEQAEAARDITGTGRVLLVEDEDIVRSFAVRALQRQGYEVLEATTGVEALEVMERIGGEVDIVVSDVVMPEMDGPTLLKHLREKTPDIKIIFVSGYPNEAFQASLAEGEHFAFLQKPFSLPQLAAKVKEELAR